VKIYFSDEVSKGYQFYKYDSLRGWSDYSHHSRFDKNRRSVTVELKDGHYRDADEVANGIIVDPSALILKESALDTGVANSSCFIATAAFGSYMDPNVKLLRDFRDEYLFKNAPGKWFVKLYYRYGPCAADFIGEHEWLKPVVRLALMPLVGISYLMVKGSWALLILATVLVVVLLLVCYRLKGQLLGRHRRLLDC
jgi:hypothetical protein